MGIVSAAAYHAGKFLQEQDLLPESRCCAWCQFEGLRSRLLAVQRNPDVWLLKCPQCRAVSTSRVATDAAIDTYYSSYYVEDLAKRVTCGNPQYHARHICRFAKPETQSPRINLLDFGGGDGSISLAVAVELAEHTTRPIDILVVDYNERLVVSPKPQIALQHMPRIEQLPAGRTFDIVLASAILEHLATPAPTTKRLLGMLTPGGYFYARTPWMVPLLQTLNRAGISMDFTFPAHFHDLGQDFWSKILPTLGMSDREWTLARSRPSLVETSFSECVLRTLASHILKAPWWVFGNSYQFTGGWEVFIKRKPVQ
jgi:SAM-dependent methyltransferase